MLPAQNGPCDCPDPNDVTYIGTSSSSITKLSDLNFTNGEPPTGCLAIAGTFVIDQAFNANSITFVMQPASKISIKGTNVHATIENSNLYGCDNMWQGIVIRDHASLLFKNNTIEDAQYAIRADKDVSLEIVSNTFHKDWVGIFIDPNGGYVNVLKGLYDNHFTCGNDDLLPAYSGQSPAPGSKTLAGFYILDTPFFPIGDSGDPTTVNYMDGIHNGIIVQKAAVSIYYQDIQNLIDNSVGTSLPIEQLKGVGVYAKDCPDLKVQYTQINNTYTGVYATRSSLNVSDNQISVMQSGVNLNSATNPSIRIANNNITTQSTDLSVKFGISIYEASDFAELRIKNNVINMLQTPNVVGLPTVGIYVFMSYPFEGANSYIGLNSINLEEGGRGIYLSSSSNIVIQGNTVSLMQTNTSNGFWAINLVTSPGCRIRDNNCTGTYPANSNLIQTGIKTSYSPQALLCCNTVDDLHEGINIAGACNNSRIATTQFNTHNYGLHYEMTGITGIQDHTGNEWHENCISWDAYHAGGIAAASASAYLIDFSQVGGDWVPNDWDPMNFILDIPGTNPNCSTWPTCGEEWPYPSLTTLDSSIASGTLGNLPYSTYTTWIAEQELYRKLMQSNLWSNNGLMSGFKSQRDTQDIGLLYPVRLAIDTTWQYDPNLSQQMNSLYTQISDKVDQIDSLYTLFPGNSASDSLSIIQQVSSLQSELAPLVSSWVSNDSSFVQNVLNNILPQINSDNQNLQVSFQPAVNERDFNGYLLQYWQNSNSLNTSEINGLYTIASQCHYTGGPAVLRARNLYELVQDTTLDWSSIENCKTSGRNARGQIGSPLTELTKIYPNPANTSVQIEIPADQMPAEGSLHYRLNDLQGHVWQEGIITAPVFEMTTAKLPTGLYLLEIRTESGQQLLQSKISIIH